jgi:hypothetical protein
MRIALGDLKAGAEQVVVLPFAFRFEDEDGEAIFTAIETAGVDPLLEATVAWWQDWASQITVIETPDAKFNDLIPGLALSIKVNQTAGGGNSQMSQYSNVWLRDTHGPSLLLPLIGLTDDYRDMLYYQWVASLQRGGLANAYPADIDLTDVPGQPDWRHLDVMDGRTKAEGPSALVLQYENYLKATGDWDRLEERYGMLYHAVMHQQFVNGCLQYFSSDETFEDVMQAALGQNILTEPEYGVLSLYSSVLMMRAAGFMAEVAATLGHSGDAAEFAQLAADVKRCMNDVYWLDDQGFYAIKAETATLTPNDRPYEDVSASLLWLDALPPADPRAVSNFEQVMAMLGHRNGSLWTKIFFLYNILFYTVHDSVQTGMSHGYWLNNLDKMFHPTADKAFRLWKDFFTPAGATDEAVIVDDYSHLSLLREPTGFLGDSSARYRSWEAGIMGHALLYHLTGFDCDVAAGTAKLAPHLPPEWDRTAFRGLACGEGRFDLEVSAGDDGGRVIAIDADAQTEFALSLVVPFDGEFAGAMINGETVPAIAQTNAYGRTVVRFEAIDVTPDAHVEIAVQATEAR